MLLLGAVLAVSSDRSTAERHAEEKKRNLIAINPPTAMVRFSDLEPNPASAMHPYLHPTTLEGKQNHSLVQTLGLNGFLHEVRLGDNGRDGQTDRNRHTAQCLRVLRELLVPAAHVAGIEVRVWPHRREIERVDAGLGEHEDADAGRLAPDTVQVVPGRVTGRAVREEGLQEVPHVVHFWRDVAVHPGFEAVRLRHVGDCFGAGEEQGAAHVGGDVAHQLPAEARDFVVVEGGEAAEEHGAEGEVHD